ncbi:mutator family transposase [Hoeflea marina]|uniref:Mutator family transposase n=1 Tax=Hoeflea marina TaxID=274592 RepID=A0A317PBV5_9HYPH|nr:mutator family transposase [Hoeflea marina]
MPKLADLTDGAERDVLDYMTFPKSHWIKLHSTNRIERSNGEFKRRIEVAGIFRNDDAIVRLAGALLLEQNDEMGGPAIPLHDARNNRTNGLMILQAPSGGTLIQSGSALRAWQPPDPHHVLGHDIFLSPCTE